MTLMIVMLLLFLLTLLGMTMYFMSSTDLKISRNVYTGTRAFYAAESGLSEAVGRLNLSSTDPEYDAAMYDDPPYDGTSLAWEYSFSGELDNGDRYEVTIEHKADTEDLDADGNTDEVVTYDKGFFTDALHYYPEAGKGYAIEMIRSTGISADGEVVMVLEITKFPMDIKAKGAVSANSNGGSAREFRGKRVRPRHGRKPPAGGDRQRRAGGCHHVGQRRQYHRLKRVERRSADHRQEQRRRVGSRRPRLGALPQFAG